MSESERGSSLASKVYNRSIEATCKRKGTMETMANIKNNVFGCCFIAFAFHFRFCFGNRFVFGLSFLPFSQPCFVIRTVHIFSFIRSKFHLYGWNSYCCCCYCCYIHFILFRLESGLLRNEQKHAYTTKTDFVCIYFQSVLCIRMCLCYSDTGNITQHHVFVHMYQCICQSHLGTESVVIDQHVNRIFRHGPKETMWKADSVREKILWFWRCTIWYSLFLSMCVFVGSAYQ